VTRALRGLQEAAQAAQRDSASRLQALQLETKQCCLALQDLLDVAAPQASLEWAQATEALHYSE